MHCFDSLHELWVWVWRTRPSGTFTARYINFIGKPGKITLTPNATGYAIDGLEFINNDVVPNKLV